MFGVQLYWAADQLLSVTMGMLWSKGGREGWWMDGRMDGEDRYMNWQ